MDAFFNKIIKYLGVEPNSKRYFRFQDVKNSFWECIKDQLVREYKGMYEIIYESNLFFFSLKISLQANLFTQLRLCNFAELSSTKMMQWS